MLLIRLAYSYVAVHGFAGFLAGFVPVVPKGWGDGTSLRLKPLLGEF